MYKIDYVRYNGGCNLRREHKGKLSTLDAKTLLERFKLEFEPLTSEKWVGKIILSKTPGDLMYDVIDKTRARMWWNCQLRVGVAVCLVRILYIQPRSLLPTSLRQNWAVLVRPG